MSVYLFDFDGTLVDSMPFFAAVMCKILDDHQVTYGPDIIKTITPLGYGGTARYFRQIGVNRPEAELLDLMNRDAIEGYTYHIEAKRNVVPVLKALKAQGHDLNVLTASPHAMLDPCLKRIGIYDLFTNVWSCDDFGTTKSDPEIYRMAAERLGVPVGDILFLDDNYHANKVAKSAGARVCGVYDPSSEEYTEEIKSITDMYIDNFAQLLD